jgi:hypothetical protein
MPVVVALHVLQDQYCTGTSTVLVQYSTSTLLPSTSISTGTGNGVGTLRVLFIPVLYSTGRSVTVLVLPAGTSTGTTVVLYYR